MAPKLTVRASWDDVANVWVATSEDVPGLATEAEHVDALLSKLERMVPELLELNGMGDPADASASFELVTTTHPQVS